MTRHTSLALVATAALNIFLSSLLPADAGPLPSVRIATAPLVSPSAAATYYGASLQHTYGPLGYGTGSSRPRPPELVELARALKGDPDLIYEYVRNNIRINFQYGLQKGALGAMIDRSGTAFDQAQLMVELLRQSGYQANYRIGTITLNGAQWAAWSGLSDSKASCQFLASGGIPASFSGSSDPGCNYAGTLVSVTLGHAWLETVINGQTVLFDPAFKEHEVKSGINLAAALGLSSGTPFSEATSTGFSQSAVGALSRFRLIGGTSAFMPEVGRYAANLTAYLRSNHPGADLATVIGGRSIRPVYRGSTGLRQTSLPYPSDVVLSVPADIPDRYRTTLFINVADPSVGTGVGALSHQFFVDEVYGRRMRLDTNYDWDTSKTGAGEGTLYQDNQFKISLTVDGVEVANYFTSLRKKTYAERFKRKLDLTLFANHPYAAAVPAQQAFETTSGAPSNMGCVLIGNVTPGTYADRCTQKTAYVLTSVSIVHGWGDIDHGLLGKWSGEAIEDKPSPRTNFSIACPLLGQPLSNATCNRPISSGDFVRDRIAASWLGQFSRMLEVQARIARGVGQHHNSIGVVYSDATTHFINQAPDVYFPGSLVTVYKDTAVISPSEEFLTVDIDSSFSLTTENANSIERRAALFSIASAASALEGSVVDQVLNLPHSVSAAQRFGWSNTPYGAVVKNDISLTQADVTDFFFQSQGSSVSLATFAADTASRNFYIVTPANRTQMTANITLGGVTTGLPSWVTQSLVALHKSAYNDAIQSYAGAGFSIVASEESFVGPGMPDGGLVLFPNYNSARSPQNTYFMKEYSKQRGGAFIAVRNDASGDPFEIAHVVTNLSGYHKGGGAGSTAAAAASFAASSVTDGLKSRFADKSRALGIDLRSGHPGYATPTLVTSGSGSGPLSLSASLHYSDASLGHSPVASIPTGNFTSSFPTPFRGFTHSWDARLTISSDGFEALGQSSALGAAETVASFMVMQDLYRTAQTSGVANAPEIARATIAIVAHYWHNRISHNTVTIRIGASSRKFVRVTQFATGGIVDRLHFASTDGDASDLIQNTYQNVVYPSCFRANLNPEFQQTAAYNYAGIEFSLRGSGGDIQTFKRWEASNSNCRPYGGFIMSEWSFPTGTKYSLTYTNGVLNKVESFAGASLLRRLSFTQSSATASGTTGAIRGEYAGPLQLSGSIVDDNNRTVAIATQAANTITLPDGGVIKLVYNAPVVRSDTHRPIPWPTLREVYEPANPATPAIRFTYDSMGRVKEVRDAISIAQGDAVRGPYKFYIADGTRGEREDPMTPAGRYAVYYDEFGRAVKHVDEAGRAVNSSYDGLDRLVSRTYPEGDQELFQYDARSNVIEMRRKAKPGSGLADLVTSATWDATWNKPLTVTDPLGRVTNLSYNASGTAGAGLVKEVLRPVATAGGVRPKYTFTYAATTGLVTQETSPIGTVQTTSVVTNHTYDAKGNRTRTVVDDTTTGKKLKTEWSYNAYGDVTRVMDPRGHVTAFTYWDTATTYSASGKFRRVAEELHSSNAVTTIGGALTGYLSAGRTWYDANGRPTKVEGPTSITGTTVTWNTAAPRSQTTYTLTGKVTTVRDAAGDTVTTSYDPLDRPDEVTDPVGRKSKTVYTAAGDVHQLRRAVGTPLEQIYSTATYTPNGLVETVTDARGNVSKTIYDGFDRASKALYPDATPANDNDNLYEAFTYDSGSRRATERRRGGQVLTYGYDDLDRVVSRSGGGLPTRSFSYDLGSRVQTVEDRNGAAISSSLSYTYDSAGRAIRERRNDWNLNVDFTLDAAGNTTTLTWPDGWQANYVFDGLNRVDRITAVLDGASRTLRDHDYDVLGRRIRTTTLSDGLAGQGTGEVITTYGLEADDDLSSLTHDYPGASADLAFTHAYSPAGQLLSMATSEPLNRYSVAGPMGTQTYQGANTLNQYPSLTPVNGVLTAMSYDLNGNLMNDGANSYTFDALNRLVSVTGSVTAGYVHDALDRRVSKFAGGVTTRFLHAGSDEIAEYTDSGVLLRRYVPGAGVDERAAMIDSGSAAPPLASLRLPHTDRLGSVMAVTNSVGAVTERFSYNAFGVSNSSSAGYPFRYTGQRIDPETGLMFYKARVYSTTLGRFLQTDPIGTKDDLNLYAYVGNDPVNKTDPTGKTFKLVKSVANVAKKTWNNGGDFRKGAADELADLADNFSTLADGHITPDDALAVVDLLTGFGEELKTLQRAADVASATVGKGKGAVHGTKVHTKFSKLITDAPNVSKEVSYKDGRVVRYGTRGSVRVDAVIGDQLSPAAIVDLKTGTGVLSPSRARHIQSHLPQPCHILCLRPDLE